MKEFLKKIKLIDFFQIELEIQKSEFVYRLRQNVDEGSTSVFFDGFEVFSSSKNHYKGEVSHSGFKIKRRKKFFDVNRNMAIASGTYHQNDNKLIINTEINAFHGMMIPIYIFIIIIYIFLISTFLLLDANSENTLNIALPFIIFHGTFVMIIPYFIMRRSVKRLKYELEREFFFLTK